MKTPSTSRLLLNLFETLHQQVASLLLSPEDFEKSPSWVRDAAIQKVLKDLSDPLAVITKDQSFQDDLEAWENHPRHTPKDWETENRIGKTTLDYSDWVNQKLGKFP